MKNNPVNWFEIYVQDMERAKKFYESVFQRTLEKLNSPELEMWAFRGNPESWGTGGSLVKMEGVPAGGNSTIVYFSCDDCGVEEARVLAAGGSIHRSKMAIGEYGFISLVVDTERNMIGLHSMK